MQPEVGRREDHVHRTQHGDHVLPGHVLSQLTRKVSSPNVFTKLSLAVADLVRLAVLLAPVAEPSTMRSPLKYLARLSTVAGASFESLGLQEFLPDWRLIRKLITAPWLQSVYAVM